MTGKSTGIAVLIILAFTTAAYFLFDTADPPPLKTAAIPETPAPGSPPTAPAAPPVADPPPILHPIEATPSSTPLPELGQSDVPFRKALGGVLGKKGLALLLSEELIHHIVVTVDNLPRVHLAADVVPLKRAEGSFITEGKSGDLAISPHNATRYAAFAAVAKAVDAAQLVAVYKQFYPLFQRAYAEIGYPKANFNDRLVTAIDDLLAAPDPDAPVRLAQPKILHEYANPDLEARSSGQKILMRIGRDNARTIKGKLKEIRQLVT